MKLWNQIFPHIFVISLKESPDRRSHIQKEFKRVGIEQFEFFDATHFSSPEVQSIKKTNRFYSRAQCFQCHKMKCQCSNNFITDYQIANWLSYIRLWKHIIDNEIPFCLICEDDINFTPLHKQHIFPIFTKQFIKMYHISFELPLAIGLGNGFHVNKHYSKQPLHLKKQNVRCNPCFCINLPMAKLFYEHYHIHHASDHFMHIEIPHRFPQVQHFVAYPMPVYESSISPWDIKFDSLVRPKGKLRRVEYFHFLLLSSLPSFYSFFLSCFQHLHLLSKFPQLGFIENFLQLIPEKQSALRFQHRFYITSSSSSIPESIQQKIDSLDMKIISIENKEEVIESVSSIFQSFHKPIPTLTLSQMFDKHFSPNQIST
jgi:GR25 family glycosyltransferase involved in LPS biosynthesis